MTTSKEVYDVVDSDGKVTYVLAPVKVWDALLSAGKRQTKAKSQEEIKRLNKQLMRVAAFVDDFGGDKFHEEVSYVYGLSFVLEWVLGEVEIEDIVGYDKIISLKKEVQEIEKKTGKMFADYQP